VAEALKDGQRVACCCRDTWCPRQLVLVQILTGDIVLWDFMGLDFFHILIVCLLDTRHSAGLNNVSFLDQFVDALRIRLFPPGQPLQVSGLPTRNCAFSAPG
jgi:hypothetical protein